MSFLSDADDQYLVMASDGTCYERGRSDRTLEQTIADIISGQFDNLDLDCVKLVNFADDIARDVTEDVATMVRDELYHTGRTASYKTLSWLHNTIGVRASECVAERENA